MRSRHLALVAISIVGALAAAAKPSLAGCEIKIGQPVRAAGEIVDAWLDRHGNAIYMLDPDPPTCDREITFIRGPSPALQCHGGQHALVVGRYEPVTFDFTGSGYLIRAESLSCR
ncbi:MAG: hypothetical protein ACM3O6_08430 [Acidobacteriota bacterium]